MEDYTELIEKIKSHLEGGGVVQITTYTKSTIYDRHHVSMFKVGKDGSPLVQRGKHWDDFRYAAVRAGRYS